MPSKDKNELDFNGSPWTVEELIESAERVMLADYPVIPIYFYSSKRLFKPYVHGETPNPLNRLYSKYLQVEAH